MIIDGGVYIGQDLKSEASAREEDILALIRANGLDRACVASFNAVYDNQDEGNAEVLDFARRHPGEVIPMAVVSPFVFSPGKGSMRAIAEQGFRIVAGFPLYRAWPVQMRAFRLLAEEAAEAGLAVQVCVSDFAELIAACSSLGGLPAPVLIRWVRGGGYLYAGEEIAWGKTHANLYFDVGNNIAVGSIRRMCGELGAHRLFMSSNAPLTYERSAYFNLYMEELSDRDYAQVAGGSLEELLAG